ncbi:ATP-binding protein [Petroclostridium sp. X23]|uniref:ATP-binding protein n=1 Tax=Petroclostridium sp. X23 TaxID=3045146 RepID=UPI0024AD787F|nr:ATP-binding protein [Petroclostridium sp. X23]WHH57194.1 ATP-binding protein [Petroclostridium sp. X23]
MINDITINGLVYKWQEEFDVNLTLAYENNSSSEWHIIREFVSNALDCVNMDIDKVQITNYNKSIHIKDDGDGYPLVYAKRIGATSKKDDSSTIGMFGEGFKMSLLTCIRKNIKVMLASMDWLIVPKLVESEGHQVLFYDIYCTGQPMNGSLVIIETIEAITEVINNLHDYFLHYSKEQCLSGNQSNGIYPLN